MNTPRVELSIRSLSGQALLDSLVAMLQSRADRFSVRAVRDRGILCKAIVEDRWADPPQWPIGLEMIKGKLIGYVAEAFDPDIGSEIYKEQVHHARFVWSSLFDAEVEENVELRRVIPDRS